MDYRKFLIRSIIIIGVLISLGRINLADQHNNFFDSIPINVLADDEENEEDDDDDDDNEHEDDDNDDDEEDNEHEKNEDKKEDNKPNPTPLANQLRIDAVPDFNFGTNQETDNPSKTTLKLRGNQIDSKTDSNTQGILQITNTKPNSGWVLKAKLDNVNRIDNNKLIPSKDTWTLNLLNQQVKNNKKQSSKVNTISLKSNENSKTIMSSNNTHPGKSTITYKNPDDANLEIPYNVKPGRYTMDINWNLTAYPTQADNSF